MLRNIDKKVVYLIRLRLPVLVLKELLRRRKTISHEELDCFTALFSLLFFRTFSITSQDDRMKSNRFIYLKLA